MSSYAPSPVIRGLGVDLSSPVAPADFPAAQPRYLNSRWAGHVGLEGLSEAEWEKHFCRFVPLPDNLSAPLALAYHGHQFGVYNPELGDGRGFLFAQVKDDRGRILDLGTKGSGQTPWSRSGDGRLTLQGGVREVLAANYLEALGVYTSKPFALFETGEGLIRNDEPSPARSAVFTRLSHSHIRFGTFQRLAYLGDAEAIGDLTAYCVEHYVPKAHQDDERNDAVRLLDHCMQATARMISGWMVSGFVHGVMNTDNMVITGESFDYGPWRFLTRSDPNFTAAYFDQAGRYRFGRQPAVGLWNLGHLAGCLAMIAEVEELEAVLARYNSVYQTAFRQAVFRRLGLQPGGDEDDRAFLTGLFSWMTESEAKWEQVFFDWFCGDKARAMDGPQAELYRQPAFASLLAALEDRDPIRPERLDEDILQRPHAVTLVHDEVIAIWDEIARHDDWSAFEAKLETIEQLRKAFDFEPEATALAPT